MRMSGVQWMWKDGWFIIIHRRWNLISMIHNVHKNGHEYILCWHGDENKAKEKGWIGGANAWSAWRQAKRSDETVQVSTNINEETVWNWKIIDSTWQQRIFTSCIPASSSLHMTHPVPSLPNPFTHPPSPVIPLCPSSYPTFVSPCLCFPLHSQKNHKLWIKNYEKVFWVWMTRDLGGVGIGG